MLEERDFIKLFPEVSLVVYMRSFLPLSFLPLPYWLHRAYIKLYCLLLLSSDNNWSNNCDYRCRGWNLDNDSLVLSKSGL